MNIGNDKFDKEVQRVISNMKELDPADPKYADIAKNLEVLCRAQSSTDRRFSKDAILASATSLAGIASILLYEKTGVVTTKAMSLITKARM